MSGPNTGLSKRIRAELARGGPGTTDEIAQRLGEPKEKVASLMSQLAHRTGGIVPISDKRPTVWDVYGAVPVEKKRKRASGSVAGPIVIPQFRWGATRLG